MNREEIIKLLNEHKEFSGNPYCWFGVKSKDTVIPINNMVRPVSIENNSLNVELLDNGKVIKEETWSLDAFLMGSISKLYKTNKI